MNTSPTSSTAGTPVTLVGGLFDVSANPNAAITSASIQFAVGGQSCNGTTNASGIASCIVTLPTAGSFTLTASYVGTTQFVPASASKAFFVAALSTAGYTATSIPTLDRWWLAVFALLMATIGAATLRMRQIGRL